MSLTERLMLAMPAEEGSVKDAALFGKMFAFSFLGIGLYWTWLFIACFSTLLFPGLHVTQGVVQTNQIVSYFGYMVVLVAACLAMRRQAFFSRHTYRATLAAAVATSVATLLLCCSTLLGEAATLAVVVLASALTGLGTGIFLIAWGGFYARNLLFAPMQIACALVVSVVAYFAIAYLPFPAFAACMTLLPLAFGAFCCLANAYADKVEPGARTAAATASATPAAEGPVRHGDRWTPFPWRPCFALGSMGLTYGLIFALAFDKLNMGTETSLMCVVANACVGVAILAYTVAVKRNFGFSQAYMAVLPLAGVGVLLFASFSVEYLFLAFVLVRVAYTLFDMMTWMQVPKIFAKTGNIKVFLMSRVSLEGGVGVGLVLFKTVLVERYVAYDWALVVAALLLFVALLLAFTNNNVENAWGLLPTARESGHRLRGACRDIAQEFKLTNREQEVMMLVMRGKNGPYIQEKLCISQNTYQTHTRNLYRKMDVHSRQELLAILDEHLYASKAVGGAHDDADAGASS